MPKGIRYTAEQKEEMRKKAQRMRKQGKRILDIAEELGISPATLNVILKGKTWAEAQKGKGGRRGTRRPSGPVGEMAEKRQRLLDIRREQEKLAQEEESLKEEIKVLYEKLGKELFEEEGI